MEEEVKSPAVKTSEQIDEKPWVFLEKELREFEKVMKQLEEGEFQPNFNFKFLTPFSIFRSGTEFNIY